MTQKNKQTRTTGKNILDTFNPTHDLKKTREVAKFGEQAVKNFSMFSSIVGDELRFTVMEILPNEKDGHDGKRPLSYKEDRLVKWSHPENLIDLEDALDYVYMYSKIFPNRKFSVGMVITEPFVILDIDNIKEELHPLSSRIKKIQELTNHTYCEISQSGKGLHFIYRGKKVQKIQRNTKYELYDSNDKKIITLTGNLLKNTKEIKELTPQQEKALEEFLWSDDEADLNDDRSAVSAPKETIEDITSLSNDELIEKIKNNTQFGYKFKSLWFKKDELNPSSGDQALCNILVFWTNYNLEKADAIFRKSLRYRDKWDQKHRSDGASYGRMTLEKAAKYDKENYKDKNIAEYLNVNQGKYDIKSDAELTEALKNERKLWDKKHEYERNGKPFVPPINSQPAEIVKILMKVVDFAIIYNNTPEQDSNLYYFNYDKGIYCGDSGKLEGLIIAVSNEVVSTKARQNILDTILKTPQSISKIPVEQNFANDPKYKYLRAVGNGILDLKAKKLYTFSSKFFITTKTDTNYNVNANKEPTFNGWSWSKSLKETAEGDVNKYNILWKVTKASIIGAYWLRKLVILSDDGHGMTGKSTFEDAVRGIVGESNTGDVKLVDFNDETKLIDAVDKQLIIGDDNDVNTPIRRYDYINPATSHDTVRVRNYFHKSQSTRLNGFILQSCNGIPPFKNPTQAFLNRLLIIRFNKYHKHNNTDSDVKEVYIHDTKFKEWLLWYVVNKVELGVDLGTTEESDEMLKDVKVENDTISNFVSNWLPMLSSSAVPCGWLYNFYTTTCVMDNMADSTLSYRRFLRDIQNNDVFKRNWLKKQTRLAEELFTKDDVDMLVDLYNSTRWGKDLKTWFPLTSISTKIPNSNGTETKMQVTDEDYKKRISKYHSMCFVTKEYNHSVLEK